MLRSLLTALCLLAVFTLVTGVFYPLAVTAVAQTVFSGRADGSLVERDGQPVGSLLISQPFSEPGYFHPRPSAIGHDPSESGGSNLGPSSTELSRTVDERATAYREANGLASDAEVPADAVTASASGLDPHISPANARLQAERVAEARGLDVEEVLELVGEATDHQAVGFLGEDGVNVLAVNLGLDRAAP